MQLEHGVTRTFDGRVGFVLSIRLRNPRLQGMRRDMKCDVMGESMSTEFVKLINVLRVESLL